MVMNTNFKWRMADPPQVETIRVIFDKVPNDHDLLDEGQVAKLLGCWRNDLVAARSEGKLTIPYFRINKLGNPAIDGETSTVAYRWIDVSDFMNNPANIWFRYRQSKRKTAS
jgi:hypothetical protein